MIVGLECTLLGLVPNDWLASCIASCCLSVRVQGFGFRVSGFGFWVAGFGFQVSGFGFRVSGFGFWASGFKFLTPERVRGLARAPSLPSTLSVRGLRVRVQGVGFEVKDSGFRFECLIVKVPHSPR
jgi:hypothetical protein